MLFLNTLDAARSLMASATWLPSRASSKTAAACHPQTHHDTRAMEMGNICAAKNVDLSFLYISWHFSLPPRLCRHSPVGHSPDLWPLDVQLVDAGSILGSSRFGYQFGGQELLEIQVFFGKTLWRHCTPQDTEPHVLSKASKYESCNSFDDFAGVGLCNFFCLRSIFQCCACVTCHSESCLSPCFFQDFFCCWRSEYLQSCVRITWDGEMKTKDNIWGVQVISSP